MKGNFYENERVALFIDGANLYSAARALGFDIDYRRLLKVFRDRVAVSARESFDAGVTALGAGDYVKAEASFKAALATDAENTSVLAYLVLHES